MNDKLDDKTLHMYSVIEDAFTLQKFIKDVSEEENVSEEIVEEGTLEGYEDQYEKRLDDLVGFVYKSKKIKERDKKLVKAAIEYSIEKYSLRERKRGEFFFQHSLRVARKIVDLGGSNIETVVGGLLHDVIEENKDYRKLKEKYQETENKIFDLIILAEKEGYLDSLTYYLRKKEKGLAGFFESYSKRLEIVSVKKHTPSLKEKARKNVAVLSSLVTDLKILKNQADEITKDYSEFKDEYLEDIKNEFSAVSEKEKIKFDVGGLVEIVDRVTKDIPDYYYNYQQKIYRTKKSGSTALLRTVRAIIAKGCDREDNIETMERLKLKENEIEKYGKFSFSTKDRLSATYKNITTINRMNNFFKDHDFDLRKEFSGYHRRAHKLYESLLEKTKKELRKDKKYLQEQLSEDLQSKHNKAIQKWVPTIKTEDEKKKYDPNTWVFDDVMEDSERSLHYSKRGLSYSKNGNEWSYIRCLAYEKVLTSFKKIKDFTLKYRAIKTKYEK
jgi:hypothetical protein